MANTTQSNVLTALDGAGQAISLVIPAAGAAIQLAGVVVNVVRSLRASGTTEDYVLLVTIDQTALDTANAAFAAAIAEDQAEINKLNATPPPAP